MPTFYTPDRLIRGPVRVLLIGCGGTGSEVLDGLARMHFAMTALGHPGGLVVTAVDGDTVSASNIGRQRFSASDVGQNKAHVLVHRYNLFFGLNWAANDRYLDASRIGEIDNRYDLLVTCVDRASVRAEIGRLARRDIRNDILWLDFGNGSTRAQVVLGHLGRKTTPTPALRLPNVFDLYPELVAVDDGTEPSCSLAEALRSQDLFVNRFVADAGLGILWRLFRDGRLDYHGAFLDVACATCRPLATDPATWAFMGYPAMRPTRKRRKHPTGSTETAAVTQGAANPFNS